MKKRSRGEPVPGYRLVAQIGKGGSGVVWEAVGLREQPDRRSGTLGLVGRDDELRALLDVWESVRERRSPALATVVGPPGIGKTRLVDEVTRLTAEDGVAFWGRCLPYGEGITYWPVGDVLKAAAGILQSDPAPMVADKP